MAQGGLLFETPGWDTAVSTVAGSGKGKKRKRGGLDKGKGKAKGEGEGEGKEGGTRGGEGGAKRKAVAKGGHGKAGNGVKGGSKGKQLGRGGKVDGKARPTKDDATRERPVEKGKTRSPDVSPMDKKPDDLATRLLSSLAGSRFRMLNEQLYTTTGSSAHRLMSTDRESFDAYHVGFRGQVKSWPLNPVDVIADKIRQREMKDGALVVVDLGCGEAGLAKRLKGGKVRVLSYDLRPDVDGWVVEADCSSHVPLPGGREGQVVDVVVCCLSLMGTDWPAMLLESRRILRPGGTLHIAEVASRLPSQTALRSFTTFLADTLGFRLVEQDSDLSTHFVVFELVKTSLVNEPVRTEVVRKGQGLLRPCIYKRR